MSARRRPLPILWLLAAALLAVKALVPTGWMPVVAGDGGIRIALCTSQGTVLATLDADGTVHRDGAPESGNRDTCPFATVAAAFDLAAPPAMPPAFAASPFSARPLPVAAMVAARRALRPPARGPPAFA